MNLKRPQILLSNDDGYLAPGLLAIYEALSVFADVHVVAPERNHSGASSSLTLHLPLSVYQANWGPQKGFTYINGTPADCVHIALTGLLPVQPDLVVSGINHGQNMGEDVLYSGTVAAAIEGYLCGVPAVAFSQVERGWTELHSCAQICQHIVQELLKRREQREDAHNPLFLFNVNIPNLPANQLKTIALTRLGARHRSQPVVKQYNPQNEAIYWIGPQGNAKIDSEGTDFFAIKQGWVSMTPLQVDMTHHSALTQWGDMNIKS